jgi:hypothetical protein
LPLKNSMKTGMFRIVIAKNRFTKVLRVNRNSEAPMPMSLLTLGIFLSFWKLKSVPVLSNNPQFSVLLFLT